MLIKSKKDLSLGTFMLRHIISLNNLFQTLLFFGEKADVILNRHHTEKWL